MSITVEFEASVYTAPTPSYSALVFAVGTAPINLVDEDNVDVPVLCSTLAEFNALFGESDDWDSHTLNEVAYAMFSLANRGPVVFVNVLDPDDATHYNSIVNEDQTMSGTPATVTLDELGCIESTVVVKSAALVVYLLTTDYTLSFDDDGYMVVTRVATGGIGAAEALKISYDHLDPLGAGACAGVVAADIVGTASGATRTGYECIEQVFPLFNYTPRILLAPGMSHEATVSAQMAAKAASINTMFFAHALCDLDDSVIAGVYTAAAAEKAAEGTTSQYQCACWPLLKIGSLTFRMSSILAGVLAQADGTDGIPSNSPHNKLALGITSMVGDSGDEVILEHVQAEVLHTAGIVTGLKWGTGGLRIWGSRTAAAPASTDQMYTDIATVRMLRHEACQLILDYWQDIGGKINRRKITRVVDNVQMRLNGLSAAEHLIGARIVALDEDNTVDDLLAGNVTFRIYAGVSPTLLSLGFIIALDSTYLADLFA